MGNEKINVAIFHNIIAPYRVPLFEKLSRHKNVELKIFFGNITKKGRKWRVNTRELNFPHEILWSIATLPRFFTINPALPIKLLSEDFDVYISGGARAPAPYFLGALITFLVAKLHRKPFILWFAETKYPKKLRKKFWKKIISGILDKISLFFIKKSNAYIAYGEGAKKGLIGFGIREEKIFVAPNATPIKDFRQKYEAADAKMLRDKLRITKDAKVILSLSYLLKRKGIHYLIRAFGKLRSERGKIALVIAGSGPYLDELKRLCGENNISDVHFVGYIRHDLTPLYYKMADIYVLPSLSDPWGLTINEAMICEKPVVTTENVGAKELIKDNGIVVPPGNEQELYEALKRLLENQEILKRMGEKSWKYIQAYSIENEAKGFINAIKYACAGRHLT
ncbi:MAG: glycosyltransferase family 4 protein [Candidatus Heimdallarchaeota archaeon]